ncbi:unnamed protein product [Rotaria magnacalcarata]
MEVTATPELLRSNVNIILSPSYTTPTVLGWFCVINRIHEPIENFLRKHEKRVDVILAYFLIETTPSSTLPQSKLYELFIPKTKYLLGHPVCQLVTELRKKFNKNTQMNNNLQLNIIPELQILKQGIREACRGWARTIKSQPRKPKVQSSSSSTTTSPINNLLPTNTNDEEQPPTVVRAPAMVDRVQRLIGYEFVRAHPKQSLITSNKQQDDIEHFVINGSTVRRRATGQNSRSNINNKDIIIEIDQDYTDPSSNREHRYASSSLGEARRRFEPTANVNNTNGYERLTHIKRFYVKILPNEPTNDLQSPINHPLSSIPTVQCRLPNARSSILNTSNELSILSVTSLTRWYSSFTRLRDAVVGNALEYTGIDEITKPDANAIQQQNDLMNKH